MERFEYRMATWPTEQESDDTLARLSALGAEGWEAVGITTRIGALPMPGMSAQVPSQTAVLLKRRLPADEA